jgi:hypothetical protein
MDRHRLGHRLAKSIGKHVVDEPLNNRAIESDGRVVSKDIDGLEDRRRRRPGAGLPARSTTGAGRWRQGNERLALPNSRP